MIDEGKEMIDDGEEMMEEGEGHDKKRQSPDARQRGSLQQTGSTSDPVIAQNQASALKWTSKIPSPGYSETQNKMRFWLWLVFPSGRDHGDFDSWRDVASAVITYGWRRQTCR